MKKKDLVLMVVAVAILLVAGYLIYTNLSPQKSSASKTVKVQVVGDIPSSINSEAIKRISSQFDAIDFTVPVDSITTGNAAIFGR